MLLRAFAFVGGIAGAVAPKQLIDVVGRLLLVGYENPEELEPSEWYVDLVRAKFALIAVAALIAPFLPTPGGDDEMDVEEGPVIDVIEGSTDQ
ncbi:hypothetical protein Halar_2169 [halophilic archaeon DL31]|jgi:hypothetical protein|nr:hypothetical protein Halar_2169 [halophilic archaeon DL31]